MIDTKSSYRIADLIHSVAERLAQCIDVTEPHRLSECSALREAFIDEVADRSGRLLAIVRDEAEMQLHWIDNLGICDFDRRPCPSEHVEDAANRLFDTVQAMPADGFDHDRLAFYIGLELAALWYPRCDGYREITGVTPSAFRPLADLPRIHTHRILIKSQSNEVRATSVSRGQIFGLTEADGEVTWMFMPV